MLRNLFLILLTALCLSREGLLIGQDFFELPPISYSDSQPVNAIQELQADLVTGKRELVYDQRLGYLGSLLKSLGISPDSQLLVYSKTSLQLHRISPVTPRAIYFNDQVYVAFLPGSDRLEISVADPGLGGVFYTLEQTAGMDPRQPPRVVRDPGNCLACHANRRTEGVPGHLLRSVYTSPSGQPHYGMGTHLTTQDSPFQKRWGGWYVTGTHGSIRHLGNSLFEKQGSATDLDAGANQAKLHQRVQSHRYLRDTSDLVALMVLTHQAEMHNLITLVHFQTRQAIHQGQAMNRILDRPREFISETTSKRIDRVVDRLVRYLLFADEVPLESPVSGTSGYRKHFQAQGPRDKKGRSLRQLDLRKRTFSYPCSYLIYSDAFQNLPPLAKKKIYRRLWEVLRTPAKQDDFQQLSAEDRLAILEILRDTIDDLPKYWHSD